MLIDWCPGGPQIRTGCVLDAGTCIQYASSTKWAIPKSPKKDKKFFFLNFSVTPLWQNVTPLWQNVTPPPYFCHFYVTPLWQNVTPLWQNVTPPPYFSFFLVARLWQNITPFHAPPEFWKSFEQLLHRKIATKRHALVTKRHAPPYFCHFYVTPLWQNVTPLWQNVTPPRLLGDSKGIWKKPLAPVSYWMRTGCRFLHPVRIQYGFTHPIFLFFLNFS